MKLADRFKIPIITFIDTPGAYPGIGAEQRGQASAIAHSIECCMSLRSPNISVIIGEGGSGGAIALAIGMGLQNAPEGFAVSMPMRRAGFSRFKSWQWGQLSAIVEPIFAVIGAAVVMAVYPVLPYALAFAAGAMIFIVVEEVIPESHSGGNADIATMGLIAGFIVMMCLDVALG